MTNEEIQALTRRYLDGETTPEEEQRLARALQGECPAEWQPIRLMLGELTAAEAEYDAIMASRRQQGASPVNGHRPAPPSTVAKHRWLWVAGIAAAASVALALVLAWPKPEQQPGELVAQQAPAPRGEECPQSGVGDVPSSAEKIQTPTPPLEERGAAAPSTAQKKDAAVHEKPQKRRAAARHQAPAMMVAAKQLPDTLGDGIWQREENVRLALQMLAECEATIERSEQQLRNNVVEATFTALPQRPQTHLVVYDNGDYMVVDDSQPQIIEL